MDKLIRFINEYGHTNNCWPFETYRIEPATEWNSSYLVLSRDDNWEWDWKDWHLTIPRLISKEYGFIKRLVDNDKIDKRAQVIKDVETWWSEIKDVVLYDKHESLLMLLSISDTPIEFLCSILKDE